MRRLIFQAVLVTLITMVSPVGAAERETIAIIGTGDLGDSLGMRLAGLDYTIVYGSRSPDSDRVKALVVATGNKASATTQREAAQQGDIVFLPIPWPAMETVAQNLGNLEGKIVVDVSAPWTQGEDGYPETRVKPSSAEMIQKWNPGAKVVKGLGTMGSMVIDNPKAVDGPVTIPVASDYRDAKERVAQIIDELGLDPVDFGPLRMAGLIESLQIIYMIPLLQRRTEEWEFFFRRNADWVCKWQDDWSTPVFDAGELATMPEKHEPLAPCP
jgi:predicted dinucleotide-binding enzyme